MPRAQQMHPVPNAQVYQDNNGNYYLIENQNGYSGNGNGHGNSNLLTMTNPRRNHNGGRRGRNGEMSHPRVQRTANQNEGRDQRSRHGFTSRRTYPQRERSGDGNENGNGEGEQRDFSQCMLTCRLYIARNRSGGSFVDSRVHSCVRYGEEDILNHHTKINTDYRGEESNYSLYVYPLFFEATREGQDMFSDFQETINRFRASHEDKRPQSLATGKKYFLPFPSVRAQQNLQHNGRYVVSLLLNTEFLNNTENPCTESDLMNRLSNDLTPFGMTIENHYVRYNDNFPRGEETEASTDVPHEVNDEVNDEVINDNDNSNNEDAQNDSVEQSEAIE